MQQHHSTQFETSLLGLTTVAEEVEAFKEAAGIRLRAKLDFSLKKPFVFHSFS